MYFTLNKYPVFTLLYTTYKDFMLDLIRKYSDLYLVEILGFCLMGNHFHLLVRMFPEYKFSNEDIKNATRAFMALTLYLRRGRSHL